jgi:hypothetical protein
MKRNKASKIFAILALLGILLSIAGTWLLILTAPDAPADQRNVLTPEKLQELLDKNPELGNTDGIKVNEILESITETSTWSEETSTGSEETK